MLDVLSQTTFRRLFSAQVVALVGTGMATVALSLLAYDLAGANAGQVLGTALAIKMAVYILLAPLSGAFVPPHLRKRALIVLDLVRAAAALTLPFVTEIWQVYVLIAVLQSASACFTPLFQSVIPEILPEEADYTKALSLSRLAYDLESLFSPMLAAGLLTVISFHGLFAGTSVGFILSAILVFGTVFPTAGIKVQGHPLQRALRGMRIYLQTPRLRGLLATNLVAAAGGAMIFVNTIVLVKSKLGGNDTQVALALAAFGCGSMLVAIALPRLLRNRSDRSVMLTSATVLTVAMIVGTLVMRMSGNLLPWAALLCLWFVSGMAYAGLITPGGRLLRRSSSADNLPFLFAAQFSLSHVCWLMAYPLAGWLGSKAGLTVAYGALAALAVAGLVAARVVWPAVDETDVPHSHENLAPDHPHWKEHGGYVDGSHSHSYFIDDVHRSWPRS